MTMIVMILIMLIQIIALIVHFMDIITRMILLSLRYIWIMKILHLSMEWKVPTLL